VELSKLGYTKIDAIDISQEMLNEAKKTKAYTRLICAALNEQRNPEIETGEYHALISTGTLVIAHVRPEALEEMIRMVKPGRKNSIGFFFLFPRCNLFRIPQVIFSCFLFIETTETVDICTQDTRKNLLHISACCHQGL